MPILSKKVKKKDNYKSYKKYYKSGFKIKRETMMAAKPS
jgi:hypothetical protein